jgi:hypothetical protein
MLSYINFLVGFAVSCLASLIGKDNFSSLVYKGFLLFFVQVRESHQARKMDASGKDVIACFEKLGVTYDMNRVRFIFYPQPFVEINCPINKIAI